VFATAADQRPEDLHQAMLGAFADYPVPMKSDLDGFMNMLAQRSFDPDLSRVVLAGNRVAAFWFVGRRDTAVYLITSGCTPEHRRQGLSHMLGARCMAALTEAGMTSLQLEVISDNAPALSLYRSLGFIERRRLGCFTLVAPDDTDDDPAPAAIAFDQSWQDVMQSARQLRDWEPSWQHDDGSILAAGDSAVCATHHDQGELSGYAVLLRTPGVIAQVAVHPARRRNGLGKALVQSLREHAPGRPLRILNADASDRSFTRFVARIGGTHFLDQFELVKKLDQASASTTCNT